MPNKVLHLAALLYILGFENGTSAYRFSRNNLYATGIKNPKTARNSRKYLNVTPSASRDKIHKSFTQKLPSKGNVSTHGRNRK